MVDEDPWCHWCGYMPAKLWMEEQQHYICGVCWHKSRVLEDMFQRVRLWRMKQKMAQLEEEVLYADDPRRKHRRSEDKVGSTR